MRVVVHARAVAEVEPAAEGRGCGPRVSLFDGIRRGAIGHADVWWINVAETIQDPLAPDLMESAEQTFAYRASGTVSDDVVAVRIEVDDGSVVEARLYDPPSGLEDVGPRVRRRVPLDAQPVGVRRRGGHHVARDRPGRERRGPRLRRDQSVRGLR